MIKPLGGGGGGAAVGLDSAQREKKCKGQATDMVLICNTYTHTIAPTHPPAHTQYIINTLNYVLFLCMVQEGGI